MLAAKINWKRYVFGMIACIAWFQMFLLLVEVKKTYYLLNHLPLALFGRHFDYSYAVAYVSLLLVSYIIIFFANHFLQGLIFWNLLITISTIYLILAVYAAHDPATEMPGSGAAAIDMMLYTSCGLFCIGYNIFVRIKQKRAEAKLEN